MATAKWSSPSAGSNIAGTTLNSLSNGSTSGRIAYDNSSNRNLYARVRIELGSINPSTGGSITLRYLGRDGSGGDEGTTASLESYTALLSSGSSTKRIMFHMVRLYPFDGGFVVVNNSGVSLASSGNALYVDTYNEDVS